MLPHLGHLAHAISVTEIQSRITHIEKKIAVDLFDCVNRSVVTVAGRYMITNTQKYHRRLRIMASVAPGVVGLPVGGLSQLSGSMSSPYAFCQYAWVLWLDKAGTCLTPSPPVVPKSGIPQLGVFNEEGVHRRTFSEASIITIKAIEVGSRAAT